MENDVFDIIRDKEFIELNEFERQEVLENCETEDQFNQMKHVLQQVASMQFESPDVSDKTKLSLDHIFDEQHVKGKRIWYMSSLAAVVPSGKPIYRQPLLYAAAVLFALFMFVPFGDDMVDVRAEQVAVLDQEDAKPELIEAEVEKEVLESDEVLTPEEIAPIELEALNETGLAGNGATFNWTSTVDPVPTTIGLASATSSDFNHPDGIFEEWATEDVLCVSVASEPDVLDLLTATF